MSIQNQDLTDREKYFLLDLSYIDIHIDRMSSDYSLENMLRDSLKIGGISLEKEKKIREMLDELPNLPSLHDIRIVGYSNHNKTGLVNGDSESGFVGYALEDASGNRGFLFRGTEGFLDVDMGDNIVSSVTGTSKQVEQAKAFFEEHMVEGATYSLYGHSKGGNLAAEVFVDHPDLDIQAYIVNGQPIHWFDLSDEQKNRLRGDQFTFIVHEGDFVSALGYVDYLDEVVKIDKLTLDPFYPHQLKSARFTPDGRFESSRPPNAADLMLQNIIVAAPFLKLIYVIPAVIIKRYSYVVMDALKIIFLAAAQGLEDIIHAVKERCVTLFKELRDWTLDQIAVVTSWFDRVITEVKGFFARLGEWFQNSTRAGVYLSAIKLNLDQLRNMATRMQRVQHQVMGIDRKLDTLRRLVKWDEKLAVAWIDVQIGYNSDVREVIDYMTKAADQFDRCERILISKANSL